ncbi:MAG: hypothetical protein HQ522_16570, partial [Bacteroidetes bacterium]|nr:hypothetical protein [Bacteroidota bacterium]
MRINTIILSLFLALVNLAELFAQNPLLRHFTSNEGLPGTTLYSMVQDRDGFLWFATDVGVARFDGINFQNYTISDGLSDNRIFNIKPDSKDRVWFMGSNGTVSYWLKGKIYNATSDTFLRNITSRTPFINCFEDNKNRLWFISGHENIILEKNQLKRFERWTDIFINSKSGPIVGRASSHSFSRYTGQELIEFKLRHYLIPFSKFSTLPDGSVLFVSKEGIVWQSDTVQKVIIPYEWESSPGIMAGLALSVDSLLWITVQGIGLYCYDLKKPLLEPKIYLKGKLTKDVLADREGNIWISTINEGLYMIPVWGEKVIVFNKENGLASNPCYSINKLKTGELLVGMDEGKVNLISGNKIFNVKTYDCDNLENKVSRILSRNDDVWIASEYGIVHQNKKTGCDHFIKDSSHLKWAEDYQRIMHINDLSLGADKIYITATNTKFEYPLNCQKTSNHWATSIRAKRYIYNSSFYCDHSGQLWNGTFQGLFSILDDSVIDHSKEDTLLTKQIISIAETKNSIMVLGTYGFGVLFYKDGKILKRVTRTEGLCNDICRKIFVHKDRVYVSTPSGVSVLHYLNGKILSIQNLNTGNFLPSNHVNDVFADDENISVATMNGVAVISQDVFENIKPVLPFLSFTEISVDDSIISLEGVHRFPYKKNSLKIRFIGINFQKPHEVNYRYRLKENQTWKTTENNHLEMSFLPPDDYYFQLQARVQNGKWSPPKSFVFTITPPFWKT